LSGVASSDSTLPKNPITAAVVVIFVHWSGATFADVSEATIWLGAVRIERGWMIGVFVHLWWLISFVLYWQSRGTPSFSDLQARHIELEHIELMRKMTQFLGVLREACASADSADKGTDHKSAELVGKLENQTLVAARESAREESFLPLIRRDWTWRYYVDFSQPAHVTGSRSPRRTETPTYDSLPRYAVPRGYSGKFFLYELRALSRLVGHRLEWHGDFLPWVLGWFAVVSIGARLAEVL
jgi:hypothetical protein